MKDTFLVECEQDYTHTINHWGRPCGISKWTKTYSSERWAKIKFEEFRIDLFNNKYNCGGVVRLYKNGIIQQEIIK